MPHNWWTLPRVHTLIKGLRSVPSPCTFPCWHIYLKSHVSKCVIIFTSNTAVTRLETLLLLQGFPHIGFLSHCCPLMYFLCSCFGFVYFSVFSFLPISFHLPFSTFHSAVFLFFIFYIYLFLHHFLFCFFLWG